MVGRDYGQHLVGPLHLAGNPRLDAVHAFAEERDLLPDRRHGLPQLVAILGQLRSHSLPDHVQREDPLWLRLLLLAGRGFLLFQLVHPPLMLRARLHW